MASDLPAQDLEALAKASEEEPTAVSLEDTQVIGDTSGYQNFSNNYGRPTSKAEPLREPEPAEKNDWSSALVITAVILSTGIFTLLLWWILRYWIL